MEFCLYIWLCITTVGNRGSFSLSFSVAFLVLREVMKWIQTLSHHATLGSVQLVVDFLMF